MQEPVVLQGYGALSASTAVCLYAPMTSHVKISYRATRSLAPMAYRSDQSSLQTTKPEMRVALVGSIAPHLTLSEPLFLQIETEQVQDGIQVIAFEPYLHTYGVGSTIEEAVSECKSMLLDLYKELEDSEGVLSRSLCQQLEYLRYHLLVH